MHGRSQREVYMRVWKWSPTPTGWPYVGVGVGGRGHMDSQTSFIWTAWYPLTLCSDCETCGLKKPGLTRSDCISEVPAGYPHRIRAPFSYHPPRTIPRLTIGQTAAPHSLADIGMWQGVRTRVCGQLLCASQPIVSVHDCVPTGSPQLTAMIACPDLCSQDGQVT